MFVELKRSVDRLEPESLLIVTVHSFVSKANTHQRRISPNDYVDLFVASKTSDQGAEDSRRPPCLVLNVLVALQLCPQSTILRRGRL